MTPTGSSCAEPSTSTETVPVYVPGAVPCGTVTWSQIGWFCCSGARAAPSHGRSASGTSLPPNET